MPTAAELRKQREYLDEKIAEAERKEAMEESPIYSLLHHSDEDKVKLFEKLYESCHEHFNNVMRNGYGGDDTDHYMYEDIMAKCLGPNVFDHMNKADRELK